VTTGCLWFTFLNQRRGRSGNIVIGILIPRSGQPVRIERRRQRTADDPSKESPTRCAMKAIDNVYGQRAYNLLSRNTSARQRVMEPRLRVSIFARRKSAFDQRLGNVESAIPPLQRSREPLSRVLVGGGLENLHYVRSVCGCPYNGL